MRTALLMTVLLASALGAAPGYAAPTTSAHTGVIEITTEAPRVRYGQLVANAPPELAELDLGPAPGAFGSRLYSRAELEQAARAAGVATPQKLPSAVRVLRKMTTLDALGVQEAAQRAYASAPRAHATLGAVKRSGKVQVPAGYTDVSLDLPKFPRRAGALSTSITIVFSRDGEPLARIDASAQFALAPEHALPEVARGSSVSLAIRRGSVEVTTPALVTRDADAGDIVQVTIRATGRSVRARLEGAGRAVFEGQP